MLAMPTVCALADFPNVPQTAGEVLSGLDAPNQGRLAIIAYHSGLLFTVPEIPSSQPGSDFFVRTWDLSDPTSPVELDNYGITPMPINAHGYFKSGDYLVLGSNWPPESPWSFRADGPESVERTTFPDLTCAGVRGCLFQPWFVGDTYWSYGDVSGDAFIELNYERLATWDHLGETGVIGHPFLLGDRLIFASDQSRTGVATYSLADPTSPVLLDVLTDGGPGGYWPELWGGDGKLYAVFPYRENGNGIRVVDVTDPTDLRYLVDLPLPGNEAMYIQFQDEYAFVGDHKVDMRTFESVLFLDGDNTVRPNDGGVGIDTSQFALPLGNLLVTGGIGTNQGMAIWAHQDAPDTRGPEVGFHVPEAGRTGYSVGAPVSVLIHETLDTTTLINGQTFIVRPLGGSAIDGRITFAFDDILTFTPDQPLLADTTYEVVLPAGGIEDVAGNGMEGYSFTFSTGAVVGGNQPPTISSFDATPYPAAPGSTVTLSASASDPDGDPVEYRFDLGDSTPKTAWSTSTSTTASYPDSGHYRTTVQVRDPSGSISTESRSVTVLVAPQGPQPTTSSQILCDEPNRRIWAVNPDNDTITAVSADGLSKEVEIPVCDDPRSVALSPSGELWVACRDSDQIGILDASSGAPVQVLSTGYGSAPVGVVFEPGSNNVFVSLDGSGEVLRYNASTKALTGSLAVGPTPRGMAVSPDGARLFVTRFLSPQDHAEIWEIDTTSMTLNQTIRADKLGGDENRDGTAAGRGTPNYLTSIVVAPDGETAWVTANKPNVERGLLFGPDLDSDNTVRNVALRLDLTTGTFLDSIDIDNSDSASALAFSPLGDYLFVTLQGDDGVTVFDALTFDETAGLGSLVASLGTRAAPQGVCVDSETNRTFVKNFMSRDLTVLDTDTLFQTGGVSVNATTVSTVASEALPTQVLVGKQIFYNGSDPRMSAEGYISCASCHLDGGQDGRTWDFTGRNEGLRNTTELRGRAGTGMGNVHWSANFDEIQDFEGDIRGPFGGTGFMDDDDWLATSDPLGPAKAGLSTELDALAAYVSSLDRLSLPKSPYRDPDGSVSAEGQIGVGVFRDLNCTSCHAPFTLTDSTLGNETLHDVGTLRTTSGSRLGSELTGIDTPTLHGIWRTAPYFHDGSAETLRDVFTVAGGEVLPAENGSPSGGASIVENWVELNNDDTVHDRAYAQLSIAGARLTLSGVDGGSGGTGAIELRYSTGYRDHPIDILVNGTPHSTLLPLVGNDPDWRHTNWGRVRVEGVNLNAGMSNTIELVPTDPFPTVSVDEVVVSTSDDLTAADPHRRALALPAAELDALEALLLQLDGRTLTGE